MEREMGAMCFIDEHHDMVAPAKLDDRLQIGNDTIISGIDHEQGFGIRVVDHGLFHPVIGDAIGDAIFQVDLRINEDRDRPAHDDGIDRRFMDISRHDDLVFGATGRHDHRLDAECRAIDQHEGIIGIVSLGQQLLCFKDDAIGIGQHVQFPGRIGIEPDDFFAEIFAKTGAQALLMPWHIKMDDVLLRVLLQSLIEGRSGMPAFHCAAAGTNLCHMASLLSF